MEITDSATASVMCQHRESARLCDYPPEVIAQYALCSVKIDNIIRDLVSESPESSGSGGPELNALESLANVVGLDLDDPEDREYAEAVMNANYSDEESEAEPEEDLEAVPDSGLEFDTDGEHSSSFTLSISQHDICFE